MLLKFVTSHPTGSRPGVQLLCKQAAEGASKPGLQVKTVNNLSSKLKDGRLVQLGPLCCLKYIVTFAKVAFIC